MVVFMLFFTPLFICILTNRYCKHFLSVFILQDDSFNFWLLFFLLVPLYFYQLLFSIYSTVFTVYFCRGRVLVSWICLLNLFKFFFGKNVFVYSLLCLFEFSSIFPYLSIYIFLFLRFRLAYNLCISSGNSVLAIFYEIFWHCDVLDDVLCVDNT